MTVYSYDAIHHRFCEAKRAVWNLRTIGFVLGVLLTAGLLNLHRSADHNISSQYMSRVAVENDSLREEVRGLLDKLRVLEGQQEKFIHRFGKYDKMFLVSTQSSADVPDSRLTVVADSTDLEARAVMIARLSHVSTPHSRR